MPPLTPQEKQDILRYLDAGKPLPGQVPLPALWGKRQVELVWNGKPARSTNIVLPFQVIEQVDEPRSEKDVPLKMERLCEWCVDVNAVQAQVKFDYVFVDEEG